MNMKFDERELSVCEVCLHLFANGEYNDGTDRAEIASKGIERIWGDRARHISPGNEDLGYRTSDCDTCGDSDHGDRYAAIALFPK